MNNMQHEARNVEPHIGSTTKNDLTFAGAWLVRHRRVPSDLADFIAEMAGLRTEARYG